MLSRIKGLSKSENFPFFLHFLGVFTGIFLVMTVIILQVMSFGIYTTVDSNLRTAQKDISSYVTLAMIKNSFNAITDNNKTTADDQSKLIPPSEVIANTDVILYSSDGNILNTLDTLSGLEYVKLDKKNLDSIVKVSLTNILGETLEYRTLTVPVKNVIYPEVAYAMIAINTNQLEEANDRYTKMIVIVMITFWVVSVGASVYLAKWSRRPILANYEKQKAFVENASHELRTPLAVLQNRLETLFRKPNSSIMDNTENIASSLDEVRNMKLLTTNLLNLARRDDGIKPDLETLSSDFFNDIFTNYQMIAEEQGKLFKVNNQVKHQVVSDRTLLKQLMTILFDNAMKYTDKNDEIVFEVKSTDKHFYLSVADQGIGISSEDKKHIFDRFYRVDKARTRQQGGFGLGLALAKQIVDSLKGTITVQDNEPKGTIFIVKF
ncbi:cell wall metabolism sensor histidine kinase WalK [Streptococcus sp. sy004]|uniref:sensor histidine kinase n=1 Tax=Streptococcus sp. sy004 TaxID=2600149 RepID=UPI0011B5048E|nr:HAMP domain-containing sensor histidine kinase [Streptococcus sp. sy004]TWT12384.1 HAMP domain-containing histidine kinase [Streptococcus sp. sy004]